MRAFAALVTRNTLTEPEKATDMSIFDFVVFWVSADFSACAFWSALSAPAFELADTKVVESFWKMSGVLSRLGKKLISSLNCAFFVPSVPSAFIHPKAPVIPEP